MHLRMFFDFIINGDYPYTFRNSGSFDYGVGRSWSHCSKDIRYILSYNVIIGVGFIFQDWQFYPKAVIGAVYI